MTVARTTSTESTTKREAGRVDAILGTDLERAEEQRFRLEREYDFLLTDPGVLQEDRDGARLILDEARATVERARLAVSRAKAGTYGMCAQCKGPIGEERLEAVPGAIRCVACETLR